MSVAATVTLIAAAVALFSFGGTLLAMRKAFKLNRASRATYEAAYNTLEEAAGLVADARGFVDGIAAGDYRS